MGLSGPNLPTSTAHWTTWPVMREQRRGRNAWCVGVMFVFYGFFYIFLVQPFPFLSLVIVFRVGVEVRVRWRRTGNSYHARWGEWRAIFVSGLGNHFCPLLLRGLCWVYPIHQPTVLNPVINPSHRFGNDDIGKFWCECPKAFVDPNYISVDD